jgi:pimeloyl-ACP methyl ester carboxylesterase
VAVTPEQLRVDANGMTFAALAWGDPAAPLALCLHGYPDTPWTWRHLGPHLAEHGWRVVAPFTRGYAPTDLAPDDDYSLVAQGQDAIALRDALGGDDHAVLIGHDWGAAAAHYVTHRAPGHFRRVATLAVPPMIAALDPARSPKTWGRWGRQLRKSWYMGFNQLPVLAEGGQDTLIPKLWADWSPGFDAREDLEHVFQALSGPGRRRAAVRYYRSIQRAEGFKAAFRIEPKQPVLFLHGEQDGCVGTELTRGRLDLLAPGSRMEYIDCAGHFLQLEQPAIVNDLVTGWATG